MSLIDSLSKEDLDRELTEAELASIAKHLVEWPDKARDLGLSEGDIDDIKHDHHSSKEQKRATMRRWKTINGNRATLRKFVLTAEQSGWEEKVSCDILKQLGYLAGILFVCYLVRELLRF